MCGGWREMLLLIFYLNLVNFRGISPTPNPSPVKREGLIKPIFTLPLFTGGRAGLGGFLDKLEHKIFLQYSLAEQAGSQFDGKFGGLVAVIENRIDFDNIHRMHFA